MREGRYKPLPYRSERYQWDGRSEYTQWWFFDGEFESGHRVMTIMMPRVFGAVEDDDNGPVPGITLAVVEPGPVAHRSHAYYPGEFSADESGMRMSFGEDFASFEDGRYRVRVLQGDVGFDLEYRPLLPPWPPFPGRAGFMAKPLLWTLAPGKYFHYASMVPRGAVEGRLFFPGGEVAVSGVGYHEQGRTDARFQGLFSYWYWNRFFLGDWTFIFPVAQAPRRALNATMRALLVYRGDECLADIFDVTGLLLRHRVLEYQKHAPSGRRLPKRALFEARWRGTDLHVEMELGQEIEAFRFQALGETSALQPVWSQHVMSVAVGGRVAGEPVDLQGEGVFESMLTGSE
ncbi:MAG: hypothetical protein V1748_08425 [Actinomycetota bacterium]